jgi:hypothetical protein
MVSLVCALTLFASPSVSSQVRAKHAGIDITVTEVKKVKEFKVPGAVAPYGPGPYVATSGHDLAVVTFEASKEIKLGDQDVKMVLVDANRQEYGKVFSQTAFYEKGNVKVVALFEVPEQASLRSLKLDETAIDVSKVSTSAK